MATNISKATEKACLVTLSKNLDGLSKRVAKLRMLLDDADFPLYSLEPYRAYYYVLENLSTAIVNSRLVLRRYETGRGDSVWTD